MQGRTGRAGGGREGSFNGLRAAFPAALAQGGHFTDNQGSPTSRSTCLFTPVIVLCAFLGQSTAPPPLTLQGKWVLSAEGKAFPPDDFRRGLQPSGLAYLAGELWTIGDQRSEFPGALLRIDPRTGRLLGPPVPLEIPAGAEGQGPEFDELRGLARKNPDYEGLATVPGEPDRLLALTEDKTPWIADIRLAKGDAGGRRATLKRLTRLALPPGLEPWRDDPNYRFEGCAVSEDSRTLYLAFERAKDELPRIYRAELTAATSGTPPRLEEVTFPFASFPRRRDKEKARLNINDLQFLRWDGRAALLAVLRDQERLCILDLERHEIGPVLDLDLRDPTGAAIEWESPEGVAYDPATARIWIINDPDSVGTNYRARADQAPRGEFASYTALLHELKLDQLRPPTKP